MAVATRGTASNYLQRAPSPSGLADVVDLILDKGLVIDAYVRVAVIGIELITIDARIVIASVDTYLRFAEAVNRLDLTQTEAAGLAELRDGDGGGGGGGGNGGGKAKGMLEGAKEKASDAKEGLKERAGRD
jgi:gas vesicle structural protein